MRDLEIFHLSQMAKSPDAAMNVYRQIGANGAVYCLGPASTRRVVKIGWTLDLNERLSTIQVAWPERILFYGFFPGTRGTEASIQELHKLQHIRGEWFTNDDDDIVDLFSYLLGRFLSGQLSLPVA